MKIAIIGTGYVGLVAGACLADMGNEVVCVDKNQDKINNLKKGIVPFFEPALEELVKLNLFEKRLTFLSDVEEALKNSKVCFIAVGTPENEDGSVDLTQVFEAAESISKSINDYKVIVDKSTVPVGTAKKIVEIIKKNANSDFDVVSNPEFLKQGNAVEDFLRPDRIIIGSNSKKATEILKEIYSPFLNDKNKLITMDVESAEMTKYASNSFLALKISFMNQLANLCEKIGADVEMVRLGMASDSRIGDKFLFPGLGYGGSCFPKDVKAIVKLADENNFKLSIIQEANKVNENQRKVFINKILNKFNSNLKDKTFAIWGLSFKPNTSDMRHSPSIEIINFLLEKGAKIKAYDPKAFDEAKKHFQNKIEYATSAYSALKDADALLLLTQWREFRHPDFEKIKSLLKTPIVFDGRNQYDFNKMFDLGFDYCCVGKVKK